MDEELQQAFRLIQEQGRQIASQGQHLAKMARLLESQMAIREAHTTVLQAILPFLRERVEFQEMLEQIHQLRLSHHLNQEVSDTFVAIYQENVNAFMPQEVRFSS